MRLRHGCFWHGCERCSRNLRPARNAAYWQTKIARNRERDLRHRGELEAAGFAVLVVWECELKADLPGIVQAIRERIQSRRCGE